MTSRNRRGTASGFARKQKQYQISSDDDDETEESSKFGGVLATLKNSSKNVPSQRMNRSTRGGKKDNPSSQKSNKEEEEEEEDEEDEQTATTSDNGRTPPPKAIVMREATQVMSPITAHKTTRPKRSKKINKNNGKKVRGGKLHDENSSAVSSYNDYEEKEYNRTVQDSFMEESSNAISSVSDTLKPRSKKDSSKMSSDSDDDDDNESESCNSDDETQVCYEVDDEEDVDSDGDDDDEEEEEEEEEEEFSDTSEEEFTDSSESEEFVPDEDDDEEDDDESASVSFIVEETPPKRRRPQRKAAVESATRIKQQSSTTKVGRKGKAGRTTTKGNNDIVSDENKNDISTLDAPTPKTNTDTNTIEEEDDSSPFIENSSSAESVIHDEEVLDFNDTPAAKSNHSNDDTVIEETPMKNPRKALDFSSPELQMAMIVDDDEVFSDDDDDVLVATIIDSNDFPACVDEDDESIEVIELEEDDNHSSTSTHITESQHSDKKTDESVIANDDDDDDGEACENDQLLSLSASSVDHSISPNVKEGNAVEKNGKQPDTMKETQIIAPFSSINMVKEKCENRFTEEITVSFSPSSGEQPVSLPTNQNVDVEENVTHQDSLKKIQSDAPVSSIKIVKPKGDNHYRQEGTVKRGKWKLGAKIGVGSFGQVHVGMNTQTGTLMAVKVFKMKGAIMKDIRTEVELMRSLKHVNIVRYLGAQMDKDSLHIFQEWVPGGAVSCLLNKFGPFSIEVIQSYISQTICGLSFLHDNDIMHRDIKGSNILVNDEGVVKLADFGASKKLKNLGDNMMMSLTVVGTPYFMSPEVFEEKYSAKADIWGIGCVAFQMAMAMPPWKDKGFTNPISLFNYIKKQKGSPPMNHPMEESFSKRQRISWNLFEKFVDRCFQQDLSERPDTKELANDPFFLTLCEDDGDDESIQYRGLFSPGHDITKDYGSPKKLYSPVKLPSPAGRPLRTKIAPFLSPPRSRKNVERRSECGTPPKQKDIKKSPSPDTREWPGWATDQLKQQNNCKESGSENIDELKQDISGLMESLALSEDSDQRSSVERRSSTIGSFTGFSNLVGLEFLDNSKATKL